MIKAILSDFSGVILFSKDKNFTGRLNDLYNHKKDEKNYDFWQYFVVNEDILSFYKKLKDNVDFYMFTTEYIQEHPPIKQKLDSIFKKIFIGKDLGLKKYESTSYKIIIEKIGLKPNEIIYIDERERNIRAAKEVGLQTIHFKSNDDAMEKINQFI